jgi:hypothetical protein
MASRFALPMCLAFAVLAAALVRGLADRGFPRSGSPGRARGLAADGGLPGDRHRRLYTDQNLGMQELDWERGIIESRPGPVLVISNKSTIPFILWHIEAIISAVAAQRGDIRYHMGQGTFKEVLVTQAIRPTSADGDWASTPTT